MMAIVPGVGKVIVRDGKRRKITSSGYVQIYAPKHSRAVDGYVLEHILVAEEMLGRLLGPYEIVHHKNRCTWDNRPANLKVMRRIPHWVHSMHEKKMRILNQNAKRCGPVKKYKLKDFVAHA